MSGHNSLLQNSAKMRKSLELTRNFIMDVLGAFKSDSASEVVFDTFSKPIDQYAKEEREQQEATMRQLLSESINGKELIALFDSKELLEVVGENSFRCDRQKLSIGLYNTLRNRILRFANSGNLTEDGIKEQIADYHQEYHVHLKRFIPEYSDFYWKCIFKPNDSMLLKTAQDLTKYSNLMWVYDNYQVSTLQDRGIEHMLLDLQPYIVQVGKDIIFTQIKNNIKELSINRAYDFQSFRIAISKSTPLHFVLLGTGESGKSAFCRQARWLFGDHEWLEKEEEVYRNSVYLNIIGSLANYEILFTNGQYTFQDKANEGYLQNVERIARDMSFNVSTLYTSKLHNQIKSIVGDPGFKKCFADRYWNGDWMCDVLEYFLSDIDRIAPPGYVPTFEDTLHIRRKTTGLVRITLPNGSTMIDTGGQRNERKKWPSVIDSNRLLYVASLSEYDQLCYEDDTTNRLEESLDCFRGLINGSWFRDQEVILLLTHLDIFKKKSERINIANTFPEYTGGLNWENGLDFIISKFLAQDITSEFHRIQYYYCNVMDGEEVRGVVKGILSIEPYIQTRKKRNWRITKAYDVFFRFR
jgi:hypothetical protein